MSFELDGTKFLVTWPQSDPLTNKIIWHYIREIAEVQYAVICEEKHQDGNDHHHAVVVFKKRVKKRKNPFNLDEAKSNVKRLKTQLDVKRAVGYVKKEGNWIEKGEKPEYLKKLDKREKVYYVLQHSNKECLDSGYFNFSEIARFDTIRSMFYNEWPNFKKREVLWFHGGTGTGKTRTAFQYLLEDYKMEEIYISSGRIDPFMNGYHGQKAVILDDLRPGFCKFEYLLRLLDGYPVSVNVKGGYWSWLAEKIIITAPIEPSLMYVNRETGQEWDNLDQLLRRIDEIKGFGELTSPSQFVSD